MGKTIAQLTDELKHMAAETLKARQAVDALLYHLRNPRYRRALAEYELGYRMPDWVWQTWEMRRGQFGTGNGRVDDSDT